MFKSAPANLPKMSGSYFIKDFLIKGGMDVAFFTGNQWNIGTRYELPKNHPLQWYDESEISASTESNNKLFSISEVEQVIKELFNTIKVQKGSISTFLRDKFPEKFKM